MQAEVVLLKDLTIGSELGRGTLTLQNMTRCLYHGAGVSITPPVSPLCTQCFVHIVGVSTMPAHAIVRCNAQHGLEPSMNTDAKLIARPFCWEPSKSIAASDVQPIFLFGLLSR
jgi:hypothetical protein